MWRIYYYAWPCDLTYGLWDIKLTSFEVYYSRMIHSKLLKILVLGFSLGQPFLSQSLMAEDLGVIESRQDEFKTAKSEMRVLRDSIKNQDKGEAMRAVAFHIDWSQKLPTMFPLGTEASISNDSDASGDIWENFERFERFNLDYQSASLKVNKDLEQGDYKAAMSNFLKVARTCKGCHENFRN